MPDSVFLAGGWFWAAGFFATGVLAGLGFSFVVMSFAVGRR